MPVSDAALLFYRRVVLWFSPLQLGGTWMRCNSGRSRPIESPKVRLQLVVNRKLAAVGGFVWAWLVEQVGHL